MKTNKRAPAIFTFQFHNTSSVFSKIEQKLKMLPKLHLSTVNCSTKLLNCNGVINLILKDKLSQKSLSRFWEPVQQRAYSSKAIKMSAWQVHEYGGLDQLSLSTTARAATIKHPSELLIKVHAASINPIDVRMMGGYGKNLLNVMRKQKDTMNYGTEFPLTLGRDFSGTVVEVGCRVTKFKVGDEVWGAIGAFRPGTHAEYTVTSQSEISKKPSNLTHVEAASVPYVAATTWAALKTVGHLDHTKASGQRILILAGSGGIGTFAIQLAKAWGMNVTTTCSTDATDLVTSLGADTVVDYTTSKVWSELQRMKRFQYILDPLGGDMTDKAANFLSPWKNSKLVTLNFPLLKNSDEMGVVAGLVKSAVTAGLTTLKGIQSGGSIRWAAFNPNGQALDVVRRLVEDGKIKPVVYQVFPFLEAHSAYQKVIDGHLRGKVVLDFEPA
ncbi:reticulon-4-interacting protein 1-like protein, mitochondrial [Elysia marginata]|uniref:NAD(P)H oxidoreductase RTN4IP1, mitochondrial n=1 Tax=Elysia marginata TaxID=1093978 RepID=A0AAV4FSC8_9GAST|nr:reticulon-4-interacting protein 1-like protein, mitochondrial [Elysia marginata]